MEGGKMLRAGVIGLGQMGGGAAVCLARTQRQLTVYDVIPDAIMRSPDGNLVPPVAANCAEVARNSDVIIVLVVTAAQVWAALQGPEGILAAAHPGLVVVVASTIALNELAEMRELAAKSGVTVVDCGVTCPPGEHTRKRIVGMVGAAPETFEKIREVLEDFTQRVEHMGGPGAGMATKIARNMMYYATWRAAFECSELAVKAGVDIGKMAIINQLSEADGSGTTLWLSMFARKAAHPTPQAAVDHIRNGMVKDVSAAKEMAEGFGVELPLIELLLSQPGDIAKAWQA
jgi:3-hydroxyisobutyrate dehydrogenase